MAVDEATKAFAESALALAVTLKAQHDDLVKARGANRDLLRNLEDQGSLSADQKKALSAAYPRPKRTKDGDASDGAASTDAAPAAKSA